MVWWRAQELNQVRFILFPFHVNKRSFITSVEQKKLQLLSRFAVVLKVAAPTARMRIASYYFVIKLSALSRIGLNNAIEICVLLFNAVLLDVISCEQFLDVSHFLGWIKKTLLKSRRCPKVTKWKKSTPTLPWII